MAKDVAKVVVWLWWGGGGGGGRVTRGEQTMSSLSRSLSRSLRCAARAAFRTDGLLRHGTTPRRTAQTRLHGKCRTRSTRSARLAASAELAETGSCRLGQSSWALFLDRDKRQGADMMSA